MPTSSTQALSKLGENHRRSISITLQLVDKTLCEWDDWTKGRIRNGVMYREKDTLSPTQKNELQRQIANVRQLIVRLRDDLQLEAKVAPTSQPISGHAATLWETLLSMESGSLRGYGTVAKELAHYLDPITEQLAAQMLEISRLFSEPTASSGE